MSIHIKLHNSPKLPVPVRTVLACLTLLVVVQTAHAAPRQPKPIRDAVAKGASVVSTFPAASGLTGWVLSHNGNYSIAFTTSDKKTLIVGELIDDKGNNLTEVYAEKYFPKSNGEKAHDPEVLRRKGKVR